MNIMLAIVAVASIAIGQVATGIFVALLVTFNVVMGSRQELKARASVEALAQLQVPHARVRRAGRVESVESVDLVPGDVVLLEAGDVVPADGRIVVVGDARAAGGRAHRRERARAKDRDDAPRGRRSRSATARTSSSRTRRSRAGRRRFVVTATGQATQMGRIADMVTATQRVRSPLQRELDGMTKIFGLLAWTAVAIIAIVGIARGQDTRDARPAVHLDRDLGDPGRAADVRADDAVVGRAASRRVEGGREVAHRRRDPRRHDGDQQRQDRHADDERDDRDDDARRRSVVPDRGRRLHRRPARSSAWPADRCPTSRAWPSG